jgi:hypothetical protein
LLYPAMLLMISLCGVILCRSANREALWLASPSVAAVVPDVDAHLSAQRKNIQEIRRLGCSRVRGGHERCGDVVGYVSRTRVPCFTTQVPDPIRFAPVGPEVEQLLWQGSAPRDGATSTKPPPGSYAVHRSGTTRRSVHSCWSVVCSSFRLFVSAPDGPPPSDRRLTSHWMRPREIGRP